MKRFLIPVDFSDVSCTAAQYGLDMAAYLSAQQIIFYHSYGDEPRHAAETDNAPIDLRQATIQRLEQLAGRLQIPANMERSILIFEADDRDVDDGIERLAAQYSISMIVMGISGLSDTDSMLIGQHTLRVAAAAPAPLLIVPRGHSFSPVKKVVYATDLREVKTTTPVDGITRLAQQLQAETHVIHVDYGAHPQTPESEDSQQQLLSALTGLNPVFTILRQHKDKAYGIFDYVNQHEIGLILMASRNYGFFERIFHNSVSKKLLNIADVPVVLLKNRPTPS